MIKLFKILYFHIIVTYLSPKQKGCRRPVLVIVQESDDE